MGLRYTKQPLWELHSPHRRQLLRYVPSLPSFSQQPFLAGLLPALPWSPYTYSTFLFHPRWDLTFNPYHCQQKHIQPALSPTKSPRGAELLALDLRWRLTFLPQAEACLLIRLNSEDSKSFLLGLISTLQAYFFLSQNGNKCTIVIPSALCTQFF